MSEKLLEISGLSVCYEGEQILNNICFSTARLPGDADGFSFFDGKTDVI